MKTDLEIIKQLEQELGMTFDATFAKEIDWDKSSAQYALNASEQVIKLLSGARIWLTLAH